MRPVVDDEGQGPELPQRRKSTNMISHFTRYTSNAPLFKPAYAQGNSIPSRIQSPPRGRHQLVSKDVLAEDKANTTVAAGSLLVVTYLHVSFYSSAFLNFFGCAALPQQVPNRKIPGNSEIPRPRAQQTRLIKLAMLGEPSSR